MSTPGLLTQTVHNSKTKLSQEKDPAFPERSKPVSAPACSHLASQLCFFFGFANGGPPILHQLYSNSHGKTMINIDKSWDGMEQV